MDSVRKVVSKVSGHLDLRKRVRIIQWLPLYTKTDMVSDLIAGITVGLTMMPQSMAYASLANLPTHYGLYSSFMGAFIYVFFGTIKEVSIGPTSLMALLTHSFTYGLSIEYIILLCFLAGCIELIMGLLKLGFLVDFISAPAISGFTSATSVIIITSQLKGLLGLPFGGENMFSFLKEFLFRANELSVTDTILGITCVIFLLAFRRLKDVNVGNKRLKKALWFLSIGRNALIVVIASTVAYYFESRYNEIPFKVSGDVPSGIPNFRLPDFTLQNGNETTSFIDMVHTLGSGVIVVPLVAILANVAIARAFVKGKTVDATQEMITLGLCNIFGSFVQSMPTCGAFTRSAVANSSGIRTPFGGIYAGTIILLALTFLTPYFYYVPKATLSAVLISAIIFMVDYEIVPKLWKKNKFDLLITVITFTVSVTYGVEQGLCAGVIVNLCPLLKLWIRPQIDHFICANKTGAEYLVVKPKLGLFYSAAGYLTSEVIRISQEIDKPIVIDCANVIDVDYTSKQALDSLIKQMKSQNREVLLFNLKTNVLTSLESIVEEHAIHCCNNEEEICECLISGKSEGGEQDVETGQLLSKV